MPVAAQPTDAPYLVRDIADAPPDPQLDSWPQFEGAVAGRALFWAGSNAESHWILWGSDGTAAGTLPISDLLAGETTSSHLSSPLCDDGQHWIIWSRSSSVGSSFVFSTDGTNGGTSMLATFPWTSLPTLSYPRPRRCADRLINGRIHFWMSHLQGLDGPTYELWSTDGSSAGTERVALLGQDPIYVGGGLPDFIRLGNIIVFSLQTIPNGFELWRTDGTAAGTGPFLSQVAGTQILAAEGFTRVGDSAFFVGFNGSDPAPLAVTDGTAGGTRVFESLFPSQVSAGEEHPFVALPGKLVLAATSGGTPQLWGVAPSSIAPEALTTLPDAGPIRPLSAQPIGGRALFVATLQLPPHETRDLLLASDGTPGGTVELTVGCDATDPCTLGDLGSMGGDEYFVVSNSSGTSLWKTDGSGVGTIEIASSFCAVGCNLVPLGASDTKLYFLAGFWWSDRALWVTDGSEAGTIELVAPGAIDFSRTQIDETAALSEGRLLFGAADGSYGYEPWTTDGTPGGTHRLVNLSSAIDQSEPRHFSASGDRVLFAAQDRPHGFEPWVSEGDAASTGLVVDVAPDIASSDAQPLASADGVWPLLADPNGNGSPRGLYYSTGAPGSLGSLGLTPHIAFSLPYNGSSLITTGQELLRFDGDPPSVAPLAQIGQGPFTSLLLFRGAQRVYFRNHLAGGLQELWATDSTVEGTRPFCDAPGYSSHIQQQWIGELGDGVVFKAQTSALGVEPYFCREGETAVLLGDIASGSAGADPDGFVAVGGWSLFAATDSDGDRELWRTDGTTAGTSRLANLSPSGSSAPAEFTPVEGGVLFTADDGTHGRELWFSDGTPGGTSLLADLAPGPQSSLPSGFEPIGGVYVFAAETLAQGRELWVTAGTPESTQPLAEIRPGPLSSWPEEITAAGGRVFLRATDERGSELWALCPSWIAEASIVGAPVQEGESATAVVTITLTSAPACGEARFRVMTSGGTATAGEDFIAVAENVALTEVGASAEVEIPLLDDSLPEDGEEIQVIVQDSLGRERAVAAVLIIDDDGGPDADGDGVSSLAEEAAPNGGDANGDGIADALQPNVASYALDGAGNGVSIELGPGCGRFTGVEISPATAYPGDPDHSYPFGMVRFVAPECVAASVRLLLHGLPADDCTTGLVRKVLRRDPATAGFADWLTLEEASVSIIDLAGATVCAASFPIVDGGPGDLSPRTMEVDDPVGLGIPSAVVEVPALAPRGLALFALLLLGAGLMRMAIARR